MNILKTLQKIGLLILLVIFLYSCSSSLWSAKKHPELKIVKREVFSSRKERQIKSLMYQSSAQIAMAPQPNFTEKEIEKEKKILEEKKEVVSLKKNTIKQANILKLNTTKNNRKTPANVADNNKPREVPLFPADFLVLFILFYTSAFFMLLASFFNFDLIVFVPVLLILGIVFMIGFFVRVRRRNAIKRELKKNAKNNLVKKQENKPEGKKVSTQVIKTKKEISLSTQMFLVTAILIFLAAISYLLKDTPVY